VSLHLPLSDATRGLFDRRAFARMQPGSVFLNTSRGGLVVEDDLYEGLASGHLAGAGLDVTWTEPIDPDDDLLRERVAVTPHVGGVTDRSYAGMAVGFVAAVERHLGR
jgi:phosphoglycerate dehydrogenase-like enzyme